MKHPFQIFVADQSGGHLFASVKNHLLAFRTSDGALIGSWADDVDLQTVQEKQLKAKREAEEKKELTDSGNEPVTKKAKTNKKEPKICPPGPGAPVIYNYLRCLALTRDEKHIIGTTDSDKAAVIFQIDYTQENCLSLIKRQVFPKRPCAVLTTIDDKSIILADKFGDVYEIGNDDSEAVPEKDLVPILGHVSMLSDVLVAEHNNQQFVLTGDRDEHIKVTHYPLSYVVKHWLFGHHEFVSCMHLPSFNKDLLISGGGDDYLLLWDWWASKQLSRVELRDLIEPHLTDAHFPPERFLQEDSPKEICVSRVLSITKNGFNLLFVLCENTNCILTFNIDENNSVTFKQKLLTKTPVVDVALVGDNLYAAVDVDSGEDLLEIFQINDDGVLEKQTSQLTAAISSHNKCEVSSREEFYPLYHIHTLRKRSEH
ncbi:hypothetical protein METBIDRAFT_43849 [Metschnikowia bicuspidata var. bicuspidata NRRL YB-4993]|uniref:Uncharacterized protein n=1 Tax=Metschnikowia bicuspidata var. bicuspidata NRRL YB-4993 TaxID=869754 RepID=A0A1A0H8Q1_9ASCO|nr:hypothetical protein METBIDRAFT_43849 [Metschnikowia bicuspidata var. bicuspidata NRRL YB-4993]OBA20262.1 hypothetical protein METBIDRAFT_43849 [Metschnikowia bicuspidata var. bicuspidata NRRL YB-4993]